MTRPFRDGEKVLLFDRKDHQYLLQLSQEAEFHSHHGVLPHALIIGQPEGVRVAATMGGIFTAVRPTLSDFVLKMPRGAQVIYPKDLGPILMIADIYPGAKVFESGIGSGALSMTMLRAGAHITGYELREDFANNAKKNVESFLGPEVLDRYQIQLRSSYDGIDETDFDRVVLDLPEPWQVIPHAVKALRPGGIFVSYSPTIIQSQTVTQTLAAHGFTMIETVEVLLRGWHIEGMSVRPDHRMVAHTGFLTSARMLNAPGSYDQPEAPAAHVPTPPGERFLP